MNLMTEILVHNSISNNTLKKYVPYKAPLHDIDSGGAKLKLVILPQKRNLWVRNSGKAFLHNLQ